MGKTLYKALPVWVRDYARLSSFVASLRKGRTVKESAELIGVKPSTVNSSIRLLDRSINDPDCRLSKDERLIAHKLVECYRENVSQRATRNTEPLSKEEANRLLSAF